MIGARREITLKKVATNISSITVNTVVLAEVKCINYTRLTLVKVEVELVFYRGQHVVL